MTEAVQIAEHYFILSNQHDLDAISELFIEASTYSSYRTGVYLGREAIMEMQRSFHGKFDKLEWAIKTIGEESPGVVRIEFTVTGEQADGTTLHESGVEYVVVYAGKLQHVEVRAA